MTNSPKRNAAAERSACVNLKPKRGGVDASFQWRTWRLAAQARAPFSSMLQFRVEE
jgi:hypothetical protein